MEGLSIAGLRRFLYLVTPNETSFPTVEETPNYVELATPWFTIFIGLEWALSVAGLVEEKGGGRLYTLPDTLTSIGAGLLQSTFKTLFRGLEMQLYIWVYEHWRLVDLAWDSGWTWLLAFIAVDLGYYTFHRISHVTSLGWAHHAMHHSSNHYNLSTALRQSFVQQNISMFFYLPEALIVPPQIHLSHTGLNLLYQFWIHTQLVDKLGPLEWILNTPSHHRVHHGRNAYCINVNYAGVLIIWDRMFGTFEAERSDEKIAYGLVKPLETFHQLYSQLFLFPQLLWKKLKRLGLWNGWRSLWHGPAWEPGKPYPPVPKIEEPIKRYEGRASLFRQVYVLAHFFVPVLVFLNLTKMESFADRLWPAFFIVASLHSFGCLFDDRSVQSWSDMALHTLFGASGVYWLSSIALPATKLM